MLEVFVNLNASYKKTFNYVHQLNAIAGWQMLTSKYEYDAGNRLVKTVRPNQTETRVTLDALDQIVLLENVCTACGDVISSYA